MSIRNDIVNAYQDEELLFLDDERYDTAIVGIGVRCGAPDVVVYDADKLAEILHKEDGCAYDDAVEWVSVNMAGAYVGERTPIFVYRWWGAQ